MLISLIRFSVCGGELNENIKENITEEKLYELYNLASRHDVVQIAADALFKNQLMPDCEMNGVFKTALMKTVFKVQKICFELFRASAVLEENKIPHMPLKGSALRVLYPEPWMRSSCDVDILVKPEDFEASFKLLTDKLKCHDVTHTPCDVGMWTDGGVHIELHHNLLDKDIKKNGTYLRKWNFDCMISVWETAVLSTGKHYQYEMTDEMFYCYHFAHMAKHFENGGCGIKAIIDLWLLDNRKSKDNPKREELLKKAKLLSFYKHIEELCSVWFSGCEHSETSRMLEKYLLSGGAYGNMENKVAFGSSKAGDSNAFAKYRIFASDDLLRYYYPEIDKRKWLMPFYQIGRWARIISKGRLKKSVNELRLSRNITSDEFEIAAVLAEKLEI